jgi:hypothetical protein
MFTAIKQTLSTATVNSTSVSSKNSFLDTALKQTSKTRSENGSLKYSTTNNPFVDQFGTLSTYRNIRSYSDIASDMSELYAIDKEKAVKFAFYIRTITRTVNYPDGTKTQTVQRGAGLKHEAIMRFIWLAINQPNTFWNNVQYIPMLGSWNDIFKMLQYDLVYNGIDGRVLDWKKFGQLILAALENPKTLDLVKKYLPQIRSANSCKTVQAQADNYIAKFIAGLLFGKQNNRFMLYRKLKTSGKAHEWQKLISKGKALEINFSTVHGRALALLVSGNFIKNNNLIENYKEWLDKQDTVKFTGYPHELFKTIEFTSDLYKTLTIDKQFKSLVETAKKDALDTTSLIVVRDTSGSMGSLANNSAYSCNHIAKSLALFFSEMLPNGAFANSWIEFNTDARLHTWKGSTPSEKFLNDHTRFVGSTNFMSVIELFCTVKNSGVAETDFPSGILCISDCEFNKTELDETNVDAARRTLLEAGFSKEYVENFKIVLWNLQTKYTDAKYETFNPATNTFYYSGYDPATIAFLTGIKNAEGKVAKEPKTDVEVFEAAMDQEILNLIS